MRSVYDFSNVEPLFRPGDVYIYPENDDVITDIVIHVDHENYKVSTISFYVDGSVKIDHDENFRDRNWRSSFRI